jgi:hypothetical protein
MKINRKRFHINHLHFSRGREKGVKISHPVLFIEKLRDKHKKEG